MIWRVSLFFFLLSLATESTGFATSVQRLSLEQLARQADLVVKGRIQDVQTQTSQDRSTITTLVVVSVEQQWKGPHLSTVVVRQPGGSTGEITQRVVGEPEFSPGEHVILFLKRADGHYAIVGAKQGKFAVKIDPLGRRETVKDLTGKEQEIAEFLSRLKETLRR